MNDRRGPEHDDKNGGHNYNLWLQNLLYINMMATIIVCLTACALIYLAFGNQLLNMTADKGKVDPWAGSIPHAELVENGIHVQSGLVYANGFEEVRANCTICHSAKLVTQNHASREGWKEIIRWMQKTQGLTDLGAQENIILDYLATNYAPQGTTRRAPLDQESIEWYVLKVD